MTETEALTARDHSADNRSVQGVPLAGGWDAARARQPFEPDPGRTGV